MIKNCTMFRALHALLEKLRVTKPLHPVCMEVEKSLD